MKKITEANGLIEEQVEYLLGVDVISNDVSVLGTYQEDYDEFVAFLGENSRVFEEGFLGDLIEKVKSSVGDKLAVASEIAKTIGLKAKVVLDLLKNKLFFRVMSEVKWDMSKLWKMLKQAYKYTIGITKVISEFIYEKGLRGTKVEKWGGEVLKELDIFLSKHPALKSIGGVGLGFTIIYIWMNMTFIGDPFYDFNMESIINAFAGKIGWADVFHGPEGFRLLTLFATGKLAGLSFPWPTSTNVAFVGAMIATFLFMMGKGDLVKKMMKNLGASSFAQLVRRKDEAPATVVG